jgi:GrpB-like predicted nucleotidyltransferase (UPF0157 family)
MHPLIHPAAKPFAEYHEWDPRYPEVVRSLVSALGPLPPYLKIEHVGSTSIPGSGGKRVIDLLALYEGGFLNDAKAFLLAAGFGKQGPEFSRAWPEERPMFLGSYRWLDEPFLIYIHVIDGASDEVRRYRVFKERLMQNPDRLWEYCACKRQIVTEGVRDTDDYAVRKRPFIHKALGQEYGLREQRPDQLPDPTSPCVTPPAGAGGPPSVATDH